VAQLRARRESNVDHIDRRLFTRTHCKSSRLWLTRFERDGAVLWFTPNRWPVLILTTLVAARIMASLWMTWRRVTHATPGAAALWLDAGAWTAVAGVFLGYGLAYTWGLRARL
jgi:hypothetical protein